MLMSAGSPIAGSLAPSTPIAGSLAPSTSPSTSLPSFHNEQTSFMPPDRVNYMRTFVTELRDMRAVPGSHAGYWADGTWRVEARRWMKSMLASEAFDDAHLFMSLMAQETLLDNVCTNLLLSAYKKRGNLPQVLHLISQMRAIGQKPDTVTFNIVVDACGKAKQTRLALNFLEEMRGAGVVPNVSTYTALIDACGKSGDVDLAESILGRMVTSGVVPNAVTFTTLIQACCRTHAFVRALAFLHQMVSSEFASFEVEHRSPGALGSPNRGHRDPRSPKLVTLVDQTPYTTLLRASLDAGDVDTASSTLGLMQAQPHAVRPDFKLVRDLTDASVRLGRLDKALDGFSAYDAWQFEPTQYQIAAYLSVCARQGPSGLDYAHHLLQLAQTASPDGRAWWHVNAESKMLMRSMLDAAVREHRIDFAFFIVDASAPPPGGSLDVSDDSLAALVGTCSSLGQGERAFELLHLLQYIKKPPTRTLFEMVARCCGNSCDALLDALTARQLLPSDEYSSSMLLEVCAQAHAFDAVERLLVRLEVLNLRPSSALVSTLLTACHAAGRNDATQRIFSRLRGLHPGAAVWAGFPAAWHRPHANDAPARPKTPESHTASTESPISVTTPPSSGSWSSAALCGARIDLPPCQAHGHAHGHAAAWHDVSPTLESAPLKPHDVDEATPPCSPTKADEIEELDRALARLAHEESTGPWYSEYCGWYSEA